jgi:hypothetical protein
MRYLRIDGNTVLDDREAHIAEFNRPGSGGCFWRGSRGAAARARFLSSAG